MGARPQTAAASFSRERATAILPSWRHVFPGRVSVSVRGGAGKDSQSGETSVRGSWLGSTRLGFNLWEDSWKIVEGDRLSASKQQQQLSRCMCRDMSKITHTDTHTYMYPQCQNIKRSSTWSHFYL
ncbi:hypothetical protein CHARACLAT_020024 [Characodon lateralis]|uniref:Uncharacterized protein n=1 Tax=Characodon lateralis TaxID=208331 RepID=A0ABU7EKP8_9TELE|nr:hypothetical protein [Characodon lateralis]